MCGRSPMGRRWRRSTAARSRRSAFRRRGSTSTVWFAAPTGCTCGSPGGPWTSCWTPGSWTTSSPAACRQDLGPAETLIKEAAEEAAIPADTGGDGGSGRDDRLCDGAARGTAARLAVLLRPDAAGRLHAPRRPTARWRRSNSGRSPVWSKRCVTTDDFKFNVNLVLIDLFLRQGLIPNAEAGTPSRKLAGGLCFHALNRALRIRRFALRCLAPPCSPHLPPCRRVP